MRRCADRDAAPGQSSLPDETSRRLSAVTLRRRCHVDHQPSPISLMLVKSTRAGGTATRARRCSGSHSGRCTRRSPFPAAGRRPSGVAMGQRFDTAFLVGLQKQGAHVASSVSSSNRQVVDGGALLSPAPPRNLAALALRSRRCLTALLRIAAITSWGIAYHCTVSPVSDRRSVGLAGKRSSAFAIWTRACG